jgi:hypothetical protein
MWWTTRSYAEDGSSEPKTGQFQFADAAGAGRRTESAEMGLSRRRARGECEPARVSLSAESINRHAVHRRRAKNWSRRQRASEQRAVPAPLRTNFTPGEEAHKALSRAAVRVNGLGQTSYRPA